MAATPAPAPETWHLLRSPNGLARAVVVLLGIVIATDLMAVVAGLNVRSGYAAVISTDRVYVTNDAQAHADLLYGFAGSLQTLAMLVTAVVFVIWFRRVRRNAEVFDASQQRMKPGWAVGAWFVPIGNLWLPRRIAAGIWAASVGTDTDGSRRTVSQTPLNLWWTAWVLSAVFSRFADRHYAQAMMPQEVVDAVVALIASDVLDIVAAVLAILFVRKLTAMQGERAALGAYPLREQSTTGPVPS
ncbi:DUF4328 domain-containing protein [Streptomyces sp. NBC_00887]|uniref:DUF4328 domain-containing protein n=1 Tax=Streptomyces sp. NBC_00887 TaxID=2975859 RepID=UPI003864692C|nr:DUF4328 domain-containing protein [Streptomyces sp. NBC_00887]